MSSYIHAIHGDEVTDDPSDSRKRGEKTEDFHTGRGKGIGCLPPVEDNYIVLLQRSCWNSQITGVLAELSKILNSSESFLFLGCYAKPRLCFSLTYNLNRNPVSLVYLLLRLLQPRAELMVLNQ